MTTFALHLHGVANKPPMAVAYTSLQAAWSHGNACTLARSMDDIIHDRNIHIADIVKLHNGMTAKRDHIAQPITKTEAAARLWRVMQERLTPLPPIVSREEAPAESAHVAEKKTRRRGSSASAATASAASRLFVAASHEKPRGRPPAGNEALVMVRENPGITEADFLKRGGNVDDLGRHIEAGRIEKRADN